MKCCGKMPRRRLSAAVVCAVLLFLSARPADAGEEGVAVAFEDLNFAVVLPEMMRGHTDITRDEQNFGSEKVTTIFIAYTAGTLSANVIVFEEMSKSFFENRHKGEPPSPSRVWESHSGRVVVLNGLQSNPFPEGTPEFELFLDFPTQMTVVFDSFRFLHNAHP